MKSSTIHVARSDSTSRHVRAPPYAHEPVESGAATDFQASMHLFETVHGQYSGTERERERRANETIYFAFKSDVACLPHGIS